jgi:hypothetical protein
LFLRDWVAHAVDGAVLMKAIEVELGRSEMGVLIADAHLALALARINEQIRELVEIRRRRVPGGRTQRPKRAKAALMGIRRQHGPVCRR